MSNARIRWLIGVLIVLAAAPLLGSGLQFDMRTLPLFYVLTSLPLGALMTLSVWVGMGRTRLLWRVAIGLTAVFYITALQSIDDLARSTEHLTTVEWTMHYLEEAGQLAILLFLLAGTFMLVGRRFEIVLLGERAVRAPRGWLRFSMLQVMVVMSALAIFLGLLRLTRSATGHAPSTWEMVTIYSFTFVAFLINSVCAAFAGLGTGKVKLNIFLVCVVSVLLGICTAIAMHNDMVDWWLFVATTFIMIVPTVTVLISLLVVRSCGYRLVRRSVPS